MVETVTDDIFEVRLMVQSMAPRSWKVAQRLVGHDVLVALLRFLWTSSLR